MYTENYNYKRGSALSWVALLVGSLALIISVLAYNRSGKDLDDLVKETTTKTVEQTANLSATVATNMPTAAATFKESAEQTKARIDLEAKLIALKTRVAINKADDQAATDVAKMRAEYDKAFVNANVEAKQQAALVDSKLDILENDLRAGTSNILLSLEASIEALRQNVSQ